MKHWFVLVLLLAISGCSRDSGVPVVEATGDPGEPTQAQPKLPTIKIYLQAEQMLAEVARTPNQLQTGMMFRTNMPENTGMLFPLFFTQRASFWMKNCPLPLSAAYIDPDGIIEEIHDLQPYNTNAVVAASDNIRFVLETPRGWFEQHHIGPGVAVTTERGPLMRTFFQNR